MVHLMSDSKVFLITPKKVTGGPESIHLLAQELNKYNIDAYIVYINGYGKFSVVDKNTDIPSYFTQYQVKVASTIEDDPKNILIFPEALQYWRFAYQFKHIQLAMWWLSWENFWVSQHRKKWFAKFFFRKFRSITHFSNSKFAETKLYAMGIPQVFPLNTNVNEQYYRAKSDENKAPLRILYNTKNSGAIKAKRLQMLAPDLDWVALENKHPDELKDLYTTSKLYLDLGDFHGKERMPREACLCGCCVILPNIGAANYLSDYPITSKYRYSVQNDMIVDEYSLIEKVRWILEHYELARQNFEIFYQQLLNAPQQFRKEIQIAFELDQSCISQRSRV